MDTTAAAAAIVEDNRTLHAILAGRAATGLRRRMSSPSTPDLSLSCARQVSEDGATGRILGLAAVAGEA
jgi:hypothetical protein